MGAAKRSTRIETHFFPFIEINENSLARSQLFESNAFWCGCLRLLLEIAIIHLFDTITYQAYEFLVKSRTRRITRNECKQFRIRPFFSVITDQWPHVIAVCVCVWARAKDLQRPFQGWVAHFILSNISSFLHSSFTTKALLILRKNILRRNE